MSTGTPPARFDGANAGGSEKGGGRGGIVHVTITDMALVVVYAAAKIVTMGEWPHRIQLRLRNGLGTFVWISTTHGDLLFSSAKLKKG